MWSSALTMSFWADLCEEMCLASVYGIFFPFHLKVRTLDSDSDTIDSHLELPILCSYNAARAPLTSLLFCKGFRSDMCLVVLRHKSNTSRTILLLSEKLGWLWEALVISYSWKDSTPSDYGTVAEIVPIVGTVGSNLVTYDNGILRTPNLLLRCSLTSSSICMMDTSLLYAGRSAGSSHSSQ